MSVVVTVTVTPYVEVAGVSIVSTCVIKWVVVTERVTVWRCEMEVTVEVSSIVVLDAPVLVIVV